MLNLQLACLLKRLKLQKQIRMQKERIVKKILVSSHQKHTVGLFNFVTAISELQNTVMEEERIVLSDEITLLHSVYTSTG